jgi:hypothetical protein|tara:strand:- start:18501 stop:22307 length:3807 start_codon:yes stop_codon:yes gene_type:complete
VAFIPIGRYISSPQIKNTQRGGVPPISGDDEEGFLSQMGDWGMSTLGWLGETLDKFGRPVRQLLAGAFNPEHKFEASELLAWVPFSDTAGLTDPKNIAYGKDITQWDDSESWWDDIAAFGVEVATDPLSFVSLGGFQALNKSGKVLKKMGVMDDAVDAHALYKLKKHPALGTEDYIPKKQILTGETAKDVVDSYRQRIMQEAPDDIITDIGAKRVKEFDDELARAFSKEGIEGQDAINKALAGETLGGMLGVSKLPMFPASSTRGINLGIPGVKRRLTTENVSRAWDKIGDTLRQAPVMKELNSLFVNKMGGALTRLGRHFAGRGKEDLADAIAQTSMMATDALRTLEKSDLFNASKVGPQVAAENWMDLRRFLEFDEEAVAKLNPVDQQNARSALERIAGNIPEDILESVNSLRTLQKSMFDMARNVGVDISPLADKTINYWRRQLDDTFGSIAKDVDELADNSLLMHPASIRRKDIYRNLPGGTPAIMELSLDKNISGALRVADDIAKKYPKGGVPADLKYAAGDLIDIENYILKPAEETENFLNKAAREYIDNRVANPRDRLESLVPQYYPNGKELDPLSPRGKEFIDNQTRDVIETLARIDPRHAAEKRPFFKVNVVDDFVDWMTHAHRTISAMEVSHSTIAAAARPRNMVQGARVSVTEAYDELLELHDNADFAREHLLRQFAKNLTGNNKAYAEKMTDLGVYPRRLDDVSAIDVKTLEEIGNQLYISSEFLGDVKNAMVMYQKPKTLNIFLRIMRAWQNAWRAGVTIIHPKFHSRNFVGGQFNNLISDQFSARSLGDTTNILNGNAVPNLAKDVFPEYPHMTDLEATNILLSEIYARDVFNPHETYRALEGSAGTVDRKLMTATEGRRRTPESIRRYLLGGSPEDAGVLRNPNLGTWGGTAADALSMLAGFGAAPGAILGRGGVDAGRAIGKEGLQLATKDFSKIYAIGHKLSSSVEAYNRIAPYITLRRKGFSPKEASKRVAKAQVDYTNLTPFEQDVMRSLFPFYSFTKGMVPFLAQDILTRPSSGIQGQLIQGLGRAERMDEQSQFAPSWMRKGLALNVGQDPNAPHRTKYLTNIGLPFEDIGDLISSPTAVLDRINPLIKTAIEQKTGRSLYFDQPLSQLENKYGWTPIGHLMGGSSEMSPWMDLIPGSTRTMSTIRRFREDPLSTAIFDMIKPWTTNTTDIGLSRAFAIEDFLEDTGRLSPEFVKSFPTRYVPRERRAALSQDPEAYRGWQMYQRAQDMRREYQKERDRRQAAGLPR